MAVQPAFHGKPVDSLTVSARPGKTRKSGGVQPVDKIARGGRAVKRPDEEPVRRAESREMRNLLPKQGRGFGLEPSPRPGKIRSEEHTSELQSLMRISYAVLCLQKKNNNSHTTVHTQLQPVQ